MTIKNSCNKTYYTIKTNQKVQHKTIIFFVFYKVYHDELIYVTLFKTLQKVVYSLVIIVLKYIIFKFVYHYSMAPVFSQLKDVE